MSSFSCFRQLIVRRNLYEKWCALLLSFALCFTLSQNAFAIDVDSGNPLACGNSTVLTANEKIAFAEKVTKQYSELNALNHRELSASYDVAQINSLMMEAAFAESQASREEYLDQLEELGIYRYPTEICNTPTPMSDSGDVAFDTTEIYYSVQEKVWVVTSSGHWRTEDWSDEQSMGGNIGVPDVFGVGFTQTSGDYDASVVRCYGVLRNGWDGAQRRINETYSRGSADGSTGFFFELQDSTATVDTSERSTRYKNTYIGSEWFASCTYSEEFAYFSGTATGFYVHTWSGAVIESISLGVQGKTAGLGIEITNMNYSFSAYGADVKF